MPSLSAFIICYNQGHLLPRQLAAFARQERQPEEVILIDDASPDNTADVMQRYCDAHPNARLIRNERNLGAIEAINIGFRAAKGTFVYGAAADDEIQPGFFATMMDVISAHPDCGFAFCDPIWESDGRAQAEHLGLSDDPRYFTPDEIVTVFRNFKLRFVPGHCTVWRRDAYAHQGLLRPELGGICDFLPMCALALRYGACYVPQPLALAVLAADTWSQRQSLDRQKLSRDYLAMINTLLSEEFADIRGDFRSARILSRNARMFKPLFASGKLFELLDTVGAARLSLSWLRSELWRLVYPSYSSGPVSIDGRIASG